MPVGFPIITPCTDWPKILISELGRPKGMFLVLF